MLDGDNVLTTIALLTWIKRNWNFGITSNLLISNKFGSNNSEKNRGIPNFQYLFPNPKYLNASSVPNIPFVLT